MITALASVAVVLTGALWATSVTRAAGQDAGEVDIRGGWATTEALSRDSDDDGWTDWIERLQGTDPHDPHSHPGAVTFDLLGTTLLTQSGVDPDRLALVDLGARKDLLGKSEPVGVLDLVSAIGALSPTGKLHARLAAGLAELQRPGVLEGMISAANDALGTKGGPSVFNPKTNGLDLTLVSVDWQSVETILQGVEIAKSHRIEFGETSDGDPFVRVSNHDEIQQHVFTDHGTESWLFTFEDQPDGSRVTYWTNLVDGNRVSFGKKVERPDGTWEQWIFDATGNETSHSSGKVGPIATSNPSPSGGGPSPSASASAGSDPSTGPSEQPSASASESPFVDPEATPPHLPTPEEAAARAELLAGLLVYTAQHKPEGPSTPLLPKPGVVDPAEPECSQPQCLVFAEVREPGLHNRPGGDPIRPGFVELPLGLPRG